MGAKGFPGTCVSQRGTFGTIQLARILAFFATQAKKLGTTGLFICGLEGNKRMGQPTSETQQSGWDSYKRLLMYAKPFWYAFAFSFVGYALYAVTQTAFAKWLQYLIDSINEGQVNDREVIAFAVVAIFMVRGVGTFLGQYGIAYAARKIVHALRTELFAKLLVLPSHFYHKEASGQILTRLTFNVEQVTGATTDALRVIIREGLTILGLLGYLLYLNWQLTLIFLAVMPLIAIVVGFASKRFRRISKRIQSSVGDVAKSATEAVKGFEIVRIFGGQQHEQARFEELSEYNRQQSMKLIVAKAINTPVVQMFVASALAMLVYLATSPTLLADMSSGEFVAFITAAGMIAKPIRQVTDVNSTIQRGIAAADSFFELLDEDAECDDGKQRLTKSEGNLELKNVFFRYHSDAENVLKDISLSIQEGEVVALVGRSGSGKSTLAKLLMRFYDPQEGSITIDGQNLKDIQLLDLRRQMSLVNQQVVLFEGTIAENIAYGALADASFEEINRAADAANVLQFTEKMEHGLNTPVGENGMALSGGQRQRVAIARAILKDAPILILDEATSALDTESERHIQSAMETVMKGRTTIVIAHRLSTIESADLIVVMEDGCIVETGKHEALLERKGAYSKLYKMQFGGE